MTHQIRNAATSKDEHFNSVGTGTEGDPFIPSNYAGILDQFGNIIADTVGQSLVITDIDHYLIHKGLSFIYSDTLTVPATGSGTNVANFIILNTTVDEVHLKAFSFSSAQADAEIILYHGTTDNDDGTPIIPHNKNFISTNTSTASIDLNPTGIVTPVGSQVQHFILTGGKHSGGLADSGAEEYVMKQNEKVLLRYTNNAAQSDTVSFTITTLDVGKM